MGNGYLKIIIYVLRGELKRNKTGAERGELVTLLDEPFLAFLFNYLPSPPSAPAVGAMFIAVTVACIFFTYVLRGESKRI
jgi:hypothetical protein